MDPLQQLYPSRGARQIGQVLGDIASGNIGTPGLREDTLRKMYDTEFALQRAKEQRGAAILSLGAADNYERLNSDAAAIAQRLDLDEAIYRASLTNPGNIMGGLLQGQAFGFRQGARDAGIARYGADNPNAHLIGLANGPQRMTYIDGQNQIDDVFRGDGSGISTTEQGRASMLKSGRAVFDAGQNGVHIIDLSTGGAMPVGEGLPNYNDDLRSPARPLGEDPFAGLHTAVPSLRVTSQHRTPERNKDVGGVPNSYHLTGEAIDIGTPNAEQQAALTQWAQANGYRIKNDYSDGHWHLEPARRNAAPPLGTRLVNAGGKSGNKAPSGYRYTAAGDLEAIPGGPAQIANDARADAAAARRSADEAKALQKQQGDQARQTASAEAANQLVSAIDTLTSHPGFSDLGTTVGDLRISTPLLRSDAKDANAQLKNIAGQVALTTMAKLKSLSSQGATGFGALSAPELRLLENSIATLQSEDISNAQIARSLKTIRDSVAKIAEWRPDAPAPSELPLGTVQQGPRPGAVEEGYRFRGGDPSNASNWERI